ncbi:anaerobic ribonucleoside-triphosphate reductase activating protein [Thermithiobacillus plumbiphilus]|uniref:Anaerobic ribonucleoside-triphosphate reductase activating protein n=1 Tax=Thermithiobacillus plumbiphilus TaxID=1729899 RepID=A0ABU9D845_9PROT
MPPLRVGGFVPLSATDYPDVLAAVVFCQGCPWRCRYCHNPHLLAPRNAAEISWTVIRRFLEGRQGLLDAVVFSGGEPTLQLGLAAAMQEVRALGMRVGLHTAGAYPRRLAQLLPLLDWVGLDYKASHASYARITGLRGSGERVRESAKLLLASGVAHEFRMTVHPALLSVEEIGAATRELAALGARTFVLQAFRPQGCADASLRVGGEAFDPRLLKDLAGLFPFFELRRA